MAGYEVDQRVRSLRWEGYEGRINRIDGNDLFVTWDGHHGDYQESPSTVCPA